MMKSNIHNLKPVAKKIKSFLQGRMGAVDAGFMVIFCVKGEVRRSKFFGPGAHKSKCCGVST